MKNKIIIANWKMRLMFAETMAVVEQFLKVYKPVALIDVVLCPSFTSLKATVDKIKEQGIFLGAQDCFWEQEGAFTGEISPKGLKDLGCRYIIIGHSERRIYLKETDGMIHKKVKAVLEQDLIPIICVGETFEERQAGNKDFIIMNQVTKAIEGIALTPNDRLIIAYEPVWVIGSGQAVSPAEVQHTNQVIRQVLIDQFDLAVVEEKFQIIYGGSVDPTNIREFLAVPNIDGALVGGASLEPITLFNIMVEGSKFNE